jgi:D-alanyl-D-alanine carboxypeptidase
MRLNYDSPKLIQISDLRQSGGVPRSAFINANPPKQLVEDRMTSPSIVPIKARTEVVPEKSQEYVITAEAYIVGNLDTGEIYLLRDPDAVHPIASVSKLVTAMVARDIIDPQKEILITEEILEPYGTAGNLAVGEIFNRDELIYPLLLDSSNDAAQALAEAVGYSTFIESMNARVSELGMESTSFEDSSGLSPQNKSSARDLFKLARYMYEEEKDVMKITTVPVHMIGTTTPGHNSHTFINIDTFAYDPNFIGGKTGRTDAAKEAMLSMFRYSVPSGIYNIGIVVLRSDYNARQIDSSVLFEKVMAKLDLVI